MIDKVSVELSSVWRSTSGVEILAALLAIVYLALAIKQQRSCWVASFISSCLYVWVFFGVRLYMNSALQAFYAAMAAYGYWQWSSATGKPDLRVTRWPISRHLIGLIAVICVSIISSILLSHFTTDAWPFVDSVETWASVFATFLVARKVYENWHWWLVIDTVSLCLYFNRGLYLTTLLFGVYLLMIFAGMREWRRSV